MSENKENTRQIILQKSVQLFAQQGYANVSVRDIAQAVGIKPASLYYHFSSKQALYICAIEESFSQKTQVFQKILEQPVSSIKKLQLYIETLTKLAFEDENFCRLIQRELLDGDDKQLQYLAEEVFKAQFLELGKLISQNSSNNDPHLMTMSILSLVLYHIETKRIRRFLPGYDSLHDDVNFIAQHVFSLIMHGLFNTNNTELAQSL